MCATSSHDPKLARKYNRASIHTWSRYVSRRHGRGHVNRSVIYGSSSHDADMASYSIHDNGADMVDLFKYIKLNTFLSSALLLSSRIFCDPVFRYWRIYAQLLEWIIFTYDWYIHQINLSRFCCKIKKRKTTELQNKLKTVVCKKIKCLFEIIFDIFLMNINDVWMA